jgi:hypothetical protein
MNKKFKELCEKAKPGLIEKAIFEQIKEIPPLPEGWEYITEFDKRFNFETKCWEFVATMIPRQTAIVTGAVGASCGDDRFEVIARAKDAIIEKTNITSSPDEMAVLDSFLYRCWQMGWLNKYKEGE